MAPLAEFRRFDAHSEVVITDGDSVPLLDGVVDELSVFAEYL